MKTACDVATDKPGRKACRTCAMAMLVSWYMDELRAHGFGEHAEALEKKALDEGSKPAEICQLMDEITTKVDEKMKQRIAELNEMFDKNAVELEKEGS